MQSKHTSLGDINDISLLNGSQGSFGGGSINGATPLKEKIMRVGFSLIGTIQRAGSP